jgi:hypothetical protein
MKTALEQSANPTKHFSPLDVVAQFSLIAAASLVFGLVLPALTAIASGVFFRESMVAKLRIVHPEIIQKLENFTKHNAELQRQVDQLDKLVLDSAIDTRERDSRTGLLEMRSEYKARLAGRPPISVQPFYQSIIMYFWPVMYTCLGSLIFLLYPRINGAPPLEIHFRDSIVMAGGIFAFNSWPLLLRNFYAGSEAVRRTVYGYSNIDVAPASFWIQQLNVAIFCVLLAVIWKQWSICLLNLESIYRNAETVPRGAFDFLYLQRVTPLLLHAQLALIVLSIPFMIYTSIFWMQIITFKDRRFLFEAITAHTLWAISIIIIVLPFSTTWLRWRSEKQDAMVHLLYSTNAEDPNLAAKLNTLQELRPTGSWNLVTSGVAVLSSLVLPIVQALFRR